MARPVKLRMVCSKPHFNVFGPENFEQGNYLKMSIEEFETIRLIDYKRLTQEECATFMEVARTTVQKMYDEARNKIAKSLVEGRPLKIEGGNYRICSEMPHGRFCNRKRCHRFNKDCF